MGALASACSGSRVLSPVEMSKLGLTARVYDVQICPHDFDHKSGDLRQAGRCEIVNCEPKGAGLECVARPAPNSKAP